MILIAKITVGVILLLVAAFWNKFKWPSLPSSSAEPDIVPTLQDLLSKLKNKSYHVSITYDDHDITLSSTPVETKEAVQ